MKDLKLLLSPSKDAGGGLKPDNFDLDRGGTKDG